MTAPEWHGGTGLVWLHCLLLGWHYLLSILHTNTTPEAPNNCVQATRDYAFLFIPARVPRAPDHGRSAESYQ
jgi:hypothetical protein